MGEERREVRGAGGGVVGGGGRHGNGWRRDGRDRQGRGGRREDKGTTSGGLRTSKGPYSGLKLVETVRSAVDPKGNVLR